MNKIITFFKNSIVFAAIVKGGSLGLIIWFLHTVIYRVVGLKPVFYNNIAEFILGGIIIGAIIGLTVSVLKSKK